MTSTEPRTDPLVATLRQLDPADRHVDPVGPRARADLDAILATDPMAPARRPLAASARDVRPSRPVRTTRRFVLAGGLVAAVAAGMVVLPSLTGGDAAFATWTAAPGDMTSQQQAEAVTACRESQAEGAGGHADRLAGADTVISERRGVWSTVVLAGADGFSALCISDDSAGLFTDAMIGSIGIPTGYVAPGPHEVVATDLGVGTMSAGDISLAAGVVGSDVVSVVYPSRTHGPVKATVNQGRFALWFPGDELMKAPSEGMDVEVTYVDGTTATALLALGG